MGSRDAFQQFKKSMRSLQLSHLQHCIENQSKIFGRIFDMFLDRILGIVGGLGGAILGGFGGYFRWSFIQFWICGRMFRGICLDCDF